MSFLERQITDPVRLRLWKRVGIGLLVLIVVAEVVLPLVFGHGHPHFSFETFPAWGSLYGLLSCAAIIVVSKWLGKAFLMEPEEDDDA